jgi:hypothetical protein
MKPLKYLSLLLFVFSSFFFQFCNKRNGCSGGVYKSAIEAYTYNKVFRLNPKKQVTFIPADTISMTANDTVYIQFLVKTKKVATNYTIGNMGNLFACTPSIILYDPLADSILIETMDDFDSAHSAGSDVSKFFRLYQPYSYDDSGKIQYYYPVSRFKEFNEEYITLDLALVKKPEFRNIRFKVHFYKSKLAEAVKSETEMLKFY